MIFLRHKAQAGTAILEGTADAVSTASRQLEKPVPYLRRIPNLLPYVKIVAVDWPYALSHSALVIPTSYVLQLAAHVFAPVILLVRIIFDVAIRAPLSALVWVMALLYPVYVFLGIAVLVGALFGLAGAGVGWFGLWLVQKEDDDDAAVGGIYQTFVQEDVKGKGKARESGMTPAPKRPKKVEFVD